MLTVNDFDQGSLDALTSSPTVATTLSSALVPLLQAKSLDGVNFDFEGDGSADQSGLTNLIEAVSGALRAADAHWQITMDTYASSAGDMERVLRHSGARPVRGRLLRHGLRAHLAGSPRRRRRSPAVPSAASAPSSSTRRWSRPPRSFSGCRSSASTGRPTTAPWRPRRPAGPTTSRSPRPRATGPSTGTRSPGRNGRATRSATNGTSRITRASTGSTRRTRWPRTWGRGAWVSGPSAWRSTGRS